MEWDHGEGEETYATDFVTAVAPEHGDEFKVGGEVRCHVGFPVVCPIHLFVLSLVSESPWQSWAT